ncbi:MAG: HAMP domain-containing sensor histidine kinase [Thermosynechococcaceae cyanobacterium]
MSKSPKNRNVKTLRWQLFLSYWLVTITILGSSSIVAYNWIVRELYRQIDDQLITLAHAATHDLTELKRRDHFNGSSPEPTDQDNDLDIPWQKLQKPTQSIEWFDAQEKRVASTTVHLPRDPLQTGFRSVNAGHLRLFAMPIYRDIAQQHRLEGYVRVSKSIDTLEAVLEQLRLGLVFGGLVALGLLGVGSLWLTQQSLNPILESLQNLQQFTADASHELRSPLTVIKTSADVMRSHPERVDPTDRPKLDAILGATKQMTELVNDLLMLARMENRLTPSQSIQTSIPLNELLEDLVEGWEAAAIAKQIALHSQSLANSLMVKGDADQLVRLFANLLSNAVNYTPDGGTIWVILERKDKWAVVKVKDTGIGIASDQLPLVFQRFWRSDKARSSRQEGTGLGLTIAQAIAHAHRGDIAATSQVGLGTCLTVRLPIVSG